MIPNIQINNQTLQEMTERELSQIDQALNNFISQTATPCVTAARNFLISIRQGYEELAAANIIAKHQSKIKKALKNPDNDTTALYDQYIRNKNIFREMYARSKVTEINLKMEVFSQELNSFLGQKPIITYVYTNRKDKKPVIFLVDDLSQIMKKGLGSKGSGIKTRIEMSAKQARQALNNSNSAIKRLAQEDYLSAKQVLNLKSSYTEVIFRYNTYKYNTKRGKIVHVILWKPQTNWKIVVMGNNKGDIKEAYVAAIINRKGFLSDFLEQNIDDFMDYVSQVDSIPGMLQGDVTETLEDGSTIEYAVKSGNASFMSLNLAINLAIEILTAQPPFDINALAEKKKQYAKDILPRNQQVTISVLEDLFDKKIPNAIKTTIQL